MVCFIVARRTTGVAHPPYAVVALTGYEIVTVFSADYNLTQKRWYDKWMPSSTLKSGGQCDPHVFNVGDSFTTNYTLFQWTIETIVRLNAGKSAIAYTGATLEDCDITALYFNGDIRTWTLDITAVANCSVANKFQVTARTAFSMTSLPGKHAPLLGVAGGAKTAQYTSGDPRGIALDVMINLAATEIADRMTQSYNLNPMNTKPIALSVGAVFPIRCPSSVGASAPCATSKPEFSIGDAAIIYPSNTVRIFDANYPVSDTNPQVVTDDTRAPLGNLIQTVHAALRVDLGNSNPNNIFLNPQYATPLVLENEFPRSSGMNSSTSMLYLATMMPTGLPIGLDKHLSDFFPVRIQGPASVAVVYLCRYQRRKSLPQAIIAVIVATLSMFSGGWAAFMLIATYLVKSKYKQANVCLEHGALDIPAYLTAYNPVSFGQEVRYRTTLEPISYDSTPYEPHLYSNPNYNPNYIV
ncbi:hypothetical protein BD779DRAFT_504440 [Infundibulicybe gibba]|nr:hypothetical protein BD779DRAFT_504440 [Infundibulicybe gibba]